MLSLSGPHDCDAELTTQDLQPHETQSLQASSKFKYPSYPHYVKGDVTPVPASFMVARNRRPHLVLGPFCMWAFGCITSVLSAGLHHQIVIYLGVSEETEILSTSLVENDYSDVEE